MFVYFQQVMNLRDRSFQHYLINVETRIISFACVQCDIREPNCAQEWATSPINQERNEIYLSFSAVHD